MGRKNKAFSKNLHQQAYNTLTQMFAFGESKKKAKATDTTQAKIFSFSTYNTYWKHIKYFLHWIQTEHQECTSLRSARKYVNEWLSYRQSSINKSGQPLSAWTIQTEAAALNKLYRIDKADPDRFQCQKRERCDIKRSRIAVKNDKHFSPTNNDELIRFCCGTGFRKTALKKLIGDDLWSRERMQQKVEQLENKSYMHAAEENIYVILKDALQLFPDQTHFLFHRRDKGGRSRFSPIIGPDKERILERLKGTPPKQKVWQHINTHADIHSYRAEYASRMYKHYARQIEDIPFDRVNRGTGKHFQGDVYVCRREERGKKLDRKAMLKCSKALGHNRISIIADNYLYSL